MTTKFKKQALPHESASDNKPSDPYEVQPMPETWLAHLPVGTKLAFKMAWTQFGFEGITGGSRIFHDHEEIARISKKVTLKSKGNIRQWPAPVLVETIKGGLIRYFDPEAPEKPSLEALRDSASDFFTREGVSSECGGRLCQCSHPEAAVVP